jgi:hypothetical protein
MSVASKNLKSHISRYLVFLVTLSSVMFLQTEVSGRSNISNAGRSLCSVKEMDVTLAGYIRIESVYGPPGWGENPGKDKKIKVPILYLLHPIKMCSDAGPGGNPHFVIVRSASVWSKTLPIRAGKGVFYGKMDEAETVSQITDFIFELTGRDAQKMK